VDYENRRPQIENLYVPYVPVEQEGLQYTMPKRIPS
jgi:hypothetical protein